MESAAIEEAIGIGVSCSDAVLQILLNASEKETNRFSPLKNWETMPDPDITIYGEIGGTI